MQHKNMQYLAGRADMPTMYYMEGAISTVNVNSQSSNTYKPKQPKEGVCDFRLEDVVTLQKLDKEIVITRQHSVNKEEDDQVLQT